MALKLSRYVLLIAFCLTSGVAIPNAHTGVRLEPSVNGFTLIRNDHGIGNIGSLFEPGTITSQNSDSVITVRFDNEAHLKIITDVSPKSTHIRIEWRAPAYLTLQDCFSFGDQQWYGGPEQQKQYWPIQQAKFEKYSYIAKEADYSAIVERYWLSSAGQYFFVENTAPLFIDYNTAQNNSLCFIAEVSAPYSTKRTFNELDYNIWFHHDAKKAHLHAVNTYLGKPSDLPDYRMIQHPIWSTWARYSRDIDEKSLLEFANEITSNGFNNTQFEIDDLWEICYGSLTVDETKFPNLKKTVEQIKSLGFRVTIWVHPFVNKGCEPWYSEGVQKGYFVESENGSLDSSWWNNNGTVPAYIDFTNPKAAEWWSSRISHILDTYNIDSVKFDAGETSWSPQVPIQYGDKRLHPGNIVRDFVHTCAEFGPQIEIRTGVNTQYLPVFVRMIDKDTLWDFDNGLATLITTTLQMNMNGYTYVLPDMIGGNGYNEFPDKELFIRWVQANVFMPALQYSFVPWDFDNETIEISRKYTDLHAYFADEIVRAMKSSMREGAPVNAPIWWVDPNDEVALAVWDEFLLGDRILAAPVVVEGARARDIYLPKGTWYAEGDVTKAYRGPTWLKNYPAPLDTLPYFVKAN